MPGVSRRCATAATTTPGPRGRWTRKANGRWRPRCRPGPPTGGSGPAGRLQHGSAATRAARCAPYPGGARCVGSGRHRSAPARVTSSRSRRPRRRLKERLPQRRAEVQARYPDAVVETWGTDEHRVGLKPILRKVWAPRGQRPRASVWHRYEWLYVVGFIHPSSGRVAWYLVPGISLEIFGAVLAAFAEEQGAGAGKVILLTLDGAGWHASANLRVPDGIILEFQPPYSPEVQPAEHLWPLCDEALVNESFDTLDDLEARLAERCCVLADQPDVLSSATHFHCGRAHDSRTIHCNLV